MPESSSVVLALAFGVGRAINQPLQIEVEQIRKDYPSWDVFSQNDLVAILDINQVIAAEQIGDHISSLNIIKQFVLWIKIKGWHEVHLVAAQQHIERCHRDLKKLAPAGVNIILKPISTPYMPDVQPWVNSPFRWWTREIIIRSLPWSLYKRLCG